MTDPCPHHDCCHADHGTPTDEPCRFDSPPFAWCWCERHMQYQFEDRLAQSQAKMDVTATGGNEAISEAITA